MGNNRELFAEMILQDFVVAYTHGKNITEPYSKFLDKLNADAKPENMESNAQRRKIVEKCRDLFKDVSKKKLIDQKISSFREEVLKNTGEMPPDSEISKMILQSFSDMIWGDDKRKYNMSSLGSTHMLSTEYLPDGTVKKVNFVPFKGTDGKQKPPHVTLRNKSGDSITIEYMGCLYYKTLSTDEYIYKHRISRNVAGSKDIYEVFSNININELPENSELRYVVFSELLSKYNLENSYANGYIGEISSTGDSQEKLKVGEELEQPGFYRYQVTENYALEYNGERIEAIRALKQQEANKNDERV